MISTRAALLARTASLGLAGIAIFVGASPATAQSTTSPASSATAPQADTSVTQASAAQPQAQAAEAAPDIIVTAQKRSERALDVPASMTIISGNDLSKGGAPSSLDLTFSTPGLKMDRNGVNTYPALRGVSSLVSGPGLDPNVATYVDGVYMSNPAAILDLADVANIVVLKGPQGTLFGRNATGGAIQITTIKPSFDFGGNLSMTYGRFNDQAFKGFVTGPIIADKLAVSLSAYEESADGYLHDIQTGKNVGNKVSQFVRGKILITPTDNLSITLEGHYGHRKDPVYQWGSPFDGITAAQGQIGAVVPSGSWNVATNQPAKFSSKDYGASVNVVADLDPGTFTVIGSYSRDISDIVNPAYGAYAPAGGYYYLAHQMDRTYALEADFASRQFGRFNFVAGFYYYYNVGAYSPVKVQSDAPPFIASIFGYESSNSVAAFAEGNYKITDALTLTAGVRFSSEKRAVKGQSGFGDFDSPPTPVTFFGDKTYDAWTPRVSLRYQLAPTTNAYFTFSQGFKSGGFDPSAVFGGTPPLTPFRPEKLTAYEVGIKTAPTRDMNFSAALYKYDYTDQQVSAFVQRNGVTLSQTINAASSSIYGADVEGRAQVTHDLNLHATLSWIHARFDSFPNAVVFLPNYQDVGGVIVPVGATPTSMDAKGNTLPRSPNITFSVGADYEKETAAGTLGLKVDYFQSGHFFFDPGNLYRQDAYSNLNASVSWTLPKTNLTFTAWGRNLTNEAVAAGSFITATPALRFWAPPRTYGVTAAIKF